ncbi:hypothetical protein EDD68_1285 [Melghiribacillus thermohalophilus]|uniref:Lipoprotein n=1 Tax=Melghiribacillus thermohalophilus TaxID=1324956 RepID=A0A4V2V0Q7_9BACI|nr:hypothetical protein [Melghiribacillus thermohalophilus]TCT17557.1 hypothetical protein EDD68_1285 [Melghiribacillus thermohalophilus]
MNQKIIYLPLFIFIILLSGCLNQTSPSSQNKTDNISSSDMEKTHSKQNQSNFKENLSYKEYQELFKTLADKLNIKGFDLKATTLGDNVTLVGENVTFGKRKYLTLDGTFNPSDPKTTQEFLVYENNDESIQITITLAYTETNLGNDMLFKPTFEGFQETNKNLISKYNFASLSYKNLVIHVHQISENKAENSITMSVLESLVKFLEERE